MRYIEELSMSAWPSLQTHLYDGWVLRTSNGYTKRANSINLLYSSTLDLVEKITYCKSYYESLNLPVVYKITSDEAFTDIDEKLESFQYKKIDETSVQLLDLSLVEAPFNSNSLVSERLSEEWISGFAKSVGIKDEVTKKTLSSMLHNINNKTIFITHKVNGISVGFGYGVVDNGYIGIFDIVVHKDYRGKGYGNAVMNKILESGKNLGAECAYLQVVVGNTVAEKMYKQLGFIEKYRYWYRKL